MMKRAIYFFLFTATLFTVSSCKQKKPLIDDAEVLHQNQDQLTEIIIYDTFSPPVASRIYAYSSLASYEAMRFANPGYESFAPKLKGFKALPVPEKGKSYNYTLAASKAFFTVVHKVVFSLDSLKDYEDNLYSSFKSNLDDSTYQRSVAFGEAIGNVILERADRDNYKSSRGKQKYLGSHEDGKWRPTAPDYLDAVEWCWGSMDGLLLDSATLASNLPDPVKYSLHPQSDYFKEISELYKVTSNLTKEQKDIARFWDDNPFVIEHHGHMMYADKKITPGGHWMGITAIACKKTKADPAKTSQAYAAAAIAMYDAFICCWDLKYKYSTVRPITVINEKIDSKWQPLLQTPPFPEYPSGHSTITRAAATVLTKMFGDNFEFEDTSDEKYIGMKRSFKSFIQAANEASISRFYGGIHYRFSLDEGSKEGKKVGDTVIEKLSL
ncbi:vanadium-dependent haloperoxidase [Rubrolithibacter danxiaensis]|uniref:vanadium-dependent haloperoxidase n=1 Tax=Rubrolithibacter danxiaensis TaxID=3390805 RepID=UPI003BF7C513